MTRLRLRNIAVPARPITIQLPHISYCAVAGECLCTAVTSSSVKPRADGRGRGVEHTTVMVPGAITLWNRGMQGDRSNPLHPVVATLFKPQLDRRELEVVKEPAAEAPRAPEEKPAEAQEAKPDTSNKPVKPGQPNSSSRRSRQRKG